MSVFTAGAPPVDLVGWGTAWRAARAHADKRALDEGRPMVVWVTYGPANAWGGCPATFSVVPEGEPGPKGGAAIADPPPEIQPLSRWIGGGL